MRVRNRADIDAWLQKWDLPAEKPKAAAPSPRGAEPAAAADHETSLALAERLLAAIIESKDATQIYSQELIEALARAGTIKQHEAKRRLQDAFPKDLAVREWWARVNEATGKAWVTSEDGRFLLSSSGGMKPNLSNAVTLMTMNDFPVAYDSFACRTILTAAPPWRETAGPWGDNDDTQAAVWCQLKNLDVPSRVTAEAIQTMAQKTVIHPVREYLNGLTWDETPRLDTWLTDYLGCQDTPYVRSVATKWTISAVNRVMEPGCQADYTLVLEGEQGKRKSTSLRVLGGEWFSDDLADIGTKDSAMQLQGNWIIEIGELDAFKRAEVTTINAWLTRRTDEFRPPYGRRIAEFPRQNVFAATTNKYDWGKDDTGLRRFWPVTTGNIDIAGLQAVRDQLWAEAFFRFNKGERGFLVGDAEGVATGEQGKRQERDAWADRVEEWIQFPMLRQGMDSDMRSTAQRIYLTDVLGHCLGLLSKDWSHAHRSRVVRILKLAKYKPARVPMDEAGPNGTRAEFWRKIVSA